VARNHTRYPKNHGIFLALDVRQSAFDFRRQLLRTIFSEAGNEAGRYARRACPGPIKNGRELAGWCDLEKRQLQMLPAADI
jgi:hypothetical protein